MPPCTLLQQAPAHKFKHTARTIESALGMSVVELFEYIDARPVASGSIGQIHRARLSQKGATLTGVCGNVCVLCQKMRCQVIICQFESSSSGRSDFCSCTCVGVPRDPCLSPGIESRDPCSSGRDCDTSCTPSADLSAFIWTQCKDLRLSCFEHCAPQLASCCLGPCSQPPCVPNSRLPCQPSGVC
eukprot:784839-Pelagomonas_calceolata.AAC.4